MMQRWTLALAASVLSLPAWAQDAPAGDVAAGHKLAAQICQTCHGLNGLATQPDMPTIAGADAGYLRRQLEAFKTGSRQNEMMSAVAPMLNNKQMDDVSAYYAAVKVTATPPNVTSP